MGLLGRELQIATGSVRPASRRRGVCSGFSVVILDVGDDGRTYGIMDGDLAVVDAD